MQVYFGGRGGGTGGGTLFALKGVPAAGWHTFFFKSRHHEAGVSDLLGNPPPPFSQLVWGRASWGGQREHLPHQPTGRRSLAGV